MSEDTPRPADNRTQSARPCPICDAPVQAAYAPFCSARCQQVDLNRWLSGGYAIPAPADPALAADEED